jgi:uncharacterized protein YwgA
MALNILKKEKAADILLALITGAKGVREIQRMVGGSYTTVYQRIREFLEGDLVEDEYITGDVYGKASSDMRLIRLKGKGQELAQSIVSSGFARPFYLPKLRERWIIASLYVCNAIRGTTRFMKLFFVLKNESDFSKKELAGFYAFRPGKYGPFSRGIEQDLEELRDLGLIRMEIRKVPLDEFSEESGSLHVYRLAQTRADVLQEALENLPKDVLRRLNFIISFNAMRTIDLLRYVYTKHPKYVRNSLIVDRVLRGDSRFHLS